MSYEYQLQVQHVVHRAVFAYAEPSYSKSTTSTLQEVPDCMKSVFWLRTLIARTWSTGEDTREAKPGAPHRICRFAAVTQAFLEVISNASCGGAPPGSNGHALATAAWNAAVLTSLLHVRGAIS